MNSEIMTIKKYVLIVFSSLLLMSCEDYLDKSPETTLDKTSVFQDFEHAQGFVEQCYGYVVNYAANIEWNVAGFLLGDETLPSKEQYKADWHWELGALNNYTWGNNYLYNNGGQANITHEQSKYRAGIWQGWKAIRMANITIATLEDENFNGNTTNDERNLLLGQAYFFRAFFHSEIMKFWGRIPYVDTVLSGNNADFEIPRPETYKECALQADADYAKAAELLPEDWSKLEGNIESLTINPTTYANSRRYINKAIVYAFKGRNLLYAASPLMHNTDTDAGLDTYAYDEELAEQAAQSLAKVIDMDNRDVLSLNLADKQHLKYCFTTKAWQKSLFPGTPEAMGDNQCEYIFGSTAEVPWAAGQLMGGSYMPYGGNSIMTPNQHFIHKVFGTANGLSCDEDPTHDFQHEFENRDPRFYFNLIIDGDEVIKNAGAAPQYKYIQCFPGGVMTRLSASKYQSGYYIKKWSLITRNKKVAGNNVVDNQAGVEWWMNMRLTDVYLMYAEALAATSKYGATGHPSFDGVSLSSLDVLNIFRDRFDMPHIEESYNMLGIDITASANKHKYMDALRRERSIEMCFEASRWMDIRRWEVAHTEDCTIKSILLFERDEVSDEKAQRGQFQNVNFQEEIVFERVCEYPKHYWLPFIQSETNMYDGFPQNPGW